MLQKIGSRGTVGAWTSLSMYMSCGMEGSRHSNEVMVLLMSCGKEEKVVGAGCKEDKPVGHTNDHKDKRPPATVYDLDRLSPTLPQPFCGLQPTPSDPVDLTLVTLLTMYLPFYRRVVDVPGTIDDSLRANPTAAAKFRDGVVDDVDDVLQPHKEPDVPVGAADTVDGELARARPFLAMLGDADC